MYHYDFHIGDYRSHTAHLTNEEDLCYRRLLDMYYDTEAPIPKETQWVSRRLRVGFEVVMSVLQDFFIEHEDGWHSLRCDEEISKYRALCEKNRVAGKLGGRPKKTQTVSKRNPEETDTKPLRTLTKNQEPVTSNQKRTDTSSSDDEAKPSACPQCPIEEIISVYHEVLPTNPQVRVRTAARDKQIAARWKQFFQEGDFEDRAGGLDCFRWYFDQVKSSRFLTGQTEKPFSPDLEWLTKASNFAKVIEGRYANGTR